MYNSSKKIAWNQNLESDLAGYIVYYGTASHVYNLRSTGVLLSGDGSTGAPAKIISGLTNGTPYFFAVTAYDQSGNESTFSGEVTATPVETKITVKKQIV